MEITGHGVGSSVVSESVNLSIADSLSLAICDGEAMGRPLILKV